MTTELLVGLLLSSGMGEKLIVPHGGARIVFDDQVEMNAFYERPQKIETGDGRYWGVGARVAWEHVLVGARATEYTTSRWTKAGYHAELGYTSTKLQAWVDADLSTFNHVRSLHLRAKPSQWFETEMAAFTYKNVGRRYTGVTVSWYLTWRRG